MTGRRPPRARVVGVALVALVTLGALGLAPSAGRAQTNATSPALVLVSQDAWTPNGGTVTMQLRADDVPAEFTVAVTAHEQLRSRGGFDDTVNGGNLGSTLALREMPFDSLPVDPATGARVLTMPLDDLRVRLNTRQSGSGVYPVEVELRDGDNRRVSGFVSHLVVADVGAEGRLAVGEPLEVAWVWPLAADPAYLPDGTPDPAVVAELQPQGRLGRQAALIGSNLDVPLTLAPSPETLEAWDALAAGDLDLAEGAAHMRAALGRNQVLAGPFVPLDLPSLLAGDLGGPIPDEFARGTSSLERFYGVLFDSSTALPGPLDNTSLDTLRVAQRRRLVVPGTALTPVEEQFTPARPYTLQRDPSDSASAITVLATDSATERFLTSDEPPALGVARVLASLAVVAGEQPNRTRGIAIANPNGWDAPDDVVSALLAGLRGNPLLQPVTVDTMLTTVPAATVDDAPDGSPVLRTVAPYQPPAPPVTARRYYNALLERDAVARLFDADDPRVKRGDRALLSSLAATWSSSPDGHRKAAALLDGIGTSVTGFLSRVRIPEQSSVTLTSNRAEIPITFRNDTGQPVTVRVRLESNRLLFPEGAERVIELPLKNHTERFTVETRGPGNFPLGVTVTTEDGLPIQTTRIGVRSSVVSGVGIFLMVGALVFLAVWWGWDIRRRRKRRARDDSPRAPVPAPV